MNTVHNVFLQSNMFLPKYRSGNPLSSNHHDFSKESNEKPFHLRQWHAMGVSVLKLYRFLWNLWEMPSVYHDDRWTLQIPLVYGMCGRYVLCIWAVRYVYYTYGLCGVSVLRSTGWSDMLKFQVVDHPVIPVQTWQPLLIHHHCLSPQLLPFHFTGRTGL